MVLALVSPVLRAMLYSIYPPDSITLVGLFLPINPYFISDWNGFQYNLFFPGVQLKCLGSSTGSYLWETTGMGQAYTHGTGSGMCWENWIRIFNLKPI